jgi:drug/metabolite transporter (DMT)-like permease
VQPRSRVLAGSALAVLAATTFAVNGPFSVVAYDLGLTPFGLAVWRSTIATATLVVFVGILVARGRSFQLIGLDRRSAVLLLLAGLTAAAINLTVFAAFERITVAVALITFYTYPAMLAVVGLVFHGEHLTRARLAALALSLAGMALVVLGQIQPSEGLRVDALGLLLAFVAALFQVAYFTIGRVGFRHVPPDQAQLGVFASSVVFSLAFGIVAGGMASLAIPLGEPKLLGVVALLGIVGAAIPGILVLSAIRSIGPTRTGILLLLEPVIAVVLAAVLLGQQVVPLQLVGGVLVLAGGVLVQLYPGGAAPMLSADEPPATI